MARIRPVFDPSPTGARRRLNHQEAPPVNVPRLVRYVTLLVGAALTAKASIVLEQAAGKKWM